MPVAVGVPSGACFYVWIHRTWWSWAPIPLVYMFLFGADTG